MSIKKKLLRFNEVETILGCSRRHVYDLLADGKIRAHNPGAAPGTRGTKILADSVDEYLSAGTIPTERWSR